MCHCKLYSICCFSYHWLDTLHLIVEVYLSDVILLTNGVKNNKWNTVGNKTQLKAKIVIVSNSKSGKLLKIRNRPKLDFKQE